MNWLLRYHPRDLPGDLIAGVTVAVMLVPQSMAYAALAGLP
ncbi:MAG: SulP family inorganic anion transporter, partial [Chloroflexota bacterium]